jgi:hypothetical protein
MVSFFSESQYMQVYLSLCEHISDSGHGMGLSFAELPFSEY